MPRPAIVRPRRRRARRVRRTPLAALALGAAAACGAGCATVRSLDGPLTDGRPLVMSGTRANLAALRRGGLASDDPAGPPLRALADLPFSATLDVLVLGFTLPTAAVASLLDD